jgi:hypothetical protein
MSMRAASVVALALWWSLPVRAEAPEPAGIRIACDGMRRIGLGVVVHDFRPGHEGEFLLLTALQWSRAAQKLMRRS